MEYNLDLHLHGLYSGAVSHEMKPRIIAEQALLKGLQGVGTGDILNPKWEKIFREETRLVRDEYFEYNNVRFILQTEVEDNSRVHHVVLFPSLAQVEEARKRLKGKTTSLESDGRPKLWLNTAEVADLFLELGCMIGPAHAFTPYTGYYSKYDSLEQGYKDNWRKLSFLELGLSADTDMADMIKELHNLSFLSNSDAHSPWPNKLGREFNTLKIEEISFEELRKAFHRMGGRKITRNIGLDPREGKYHKTRCRNCYTFYEPEEAEQFNWRCPLCGGVIKKGVDHRIKELADLPKGEHPEHRPRYIHIIPLSEIISLALKKKNPYSKEVQETWKKIIKETGTEIKALLDTDLETIKKINKRVAEYLEYFRKGEIQYIPGGAGMYGQLIPPGEKVEMKTYKSQTAQKTLMDF
ncbi:TIGR00375 family protein [Candidatus Woesearchaeota archaeon]|nr:TIGR00375 family protein [Candidatus Woesearchaeota archaeon]